MPPANAGDWAARLEPGRLEAAPLPTTLTAGLRRLLDPFDAADAARLIEFEALLTRQKPPFAYAIAVSQGRLVHAWAAGADAAAATGSARRRCAERYLVICQPVLVDGAFRRRSFFDVARALGSQPPRVVRSAWMQSVADAAVEIRREEAARQKVESARAAAPERTLPLAPAPAASPAVQAPAQMPALMPAAQAEWIRARTRLRDSGPRELAPALAMLLGAEAAAERQQLEHLQDRVRKLRWKSALAMGESQSGQIALSYVQGQSRTDWAEERALATCSPKARGGCVVVSVNGDYRPAAMNEIANRLGTLPQARVREGFLRSVRREFP